MSKSTLHIELARKSLVWLETKATQRGIRGCEELIVSSGYVVDAAAISGLQLAWEEGLTGLPKSRRSMEACDDYSFVFESKVSRADFQNTFIRKGNHGGDRLIPIANFHFIIAPKNMIQLEEVPAFWGLLEKSGVGLKLSKKPAYQPQSLSDLMEFAYKILRGSHANKFTVFSDEIIRYREQQLSIDTEAIDAESLNTQQD